MPLSLPPTHAFRIALGAGLLLATAACAASPPPIVLRPTAASRHTASTRAREAARVPRCDPAARPALTDAEKTRLFDEFDGWQGERQPSGATAAAALPPPSPARNRAAPQGCRVSRS